MGHEKLPENSHIIIHYKFPFVSSTNTEPFERMRSLGLSNVISTCGYNYYSITMSYTIVCVLLHNNPNYQMHLFIIQLLG